MSLFNYLVNKSRRQRSRLNHRNFWYLGVYIFAQNSLFATLYFPSGLVVDVFTLRRLGDSCITTGGIQFNEDEDYYIHHYDQYNNPIYEYIRDIPVHP